MAYIEVIKWNHEEALSEEFLKTKFSPKSKFRVSADKIPPGENFPGSSREGLFFVLSGSCKLEFDCSSVTLKKGTYARIPSGSYWFYNIGQDPVKVVRVWDLDQIVKDAN